MPVSRSSEDQMTLRNPDLTSPAAGTRGPATVGGLAALVIWSTTVAVARSMFESLGALTGGALCLGIGGLVGLILAWLRGSSPKAMLGLPRKYLFGCGALFAAYMVCLFAAIGLAPNRSMTLVVGLVNYLWPALTVALSVQILRRRAHWMVVVGCLVAVSGTACAVLGDSGFNWAEMRGTGLGIVLPLGLAGVAAVTWALYSNLVKRWGRPGAGAVPLFLLASSAVLGLLRLGAVETTVWTTRAALELGIIAVAQSAFAYALWDRGMRCGNHLLLSVASYFTPIASTAVAAAYLGVTPGPGLLIGCILVAGGALISRFSLAEEGQATESPGASAEKAGVSECNH